MSACLNCHAALDIEPAPAFCPRCGQSTTLSPSVLALAREFTFRYARTLAMLLAQPGRLTQEFLAGRRLAYVAPLRLYLNASLLFFLLVKVLGFSSAVHLEFATIDERGRVMTEAQRSAEYHAAVADMRRCVDQPGSCSWARTQGSRFGLKTMAQTEHSDTLVERAFGLAPYAVFVLLPVFALLLRIAYRKRHLRYGACFVFSLHLHTVGFIALLAAAVLPPLAKPIVIPVFAAYVLLAMHRVYGGRWWATFARALPVAAAYGVALLVTTAGLFVVSVVAS